MTPKDLDTIKREYENKVDQYRINLKKLGVNVVEKDYSNDIFTILEPEKDILNRRMLIIGIVMIWEDFIFDINQLYKDRIKMASPNKSILREMKERKGDNPKLFLESHDFIRFYRNCVFHNNCRIQYKENGIEFKKLKQKDLILVNSSGNFINTNDFSIGVIFTSIEALYNLVLSDIKYL